MWRSPRRTVGLIIGMRRDEGRQRQAGRFDPAHMRHRLQFEAEPARVVELRHQHRLKQAGSGKQEVASIRPGQALLKRHQGLGQPVAIPAVDRLLGLTELMLQILQDRQVERRVQFGGDP